MLDYDFFIRTGHWRCHALVSGVIPVENHGGGVKMRGADQRVELVGTVRCCLGDVETGDG